MFAILDDDDHGHRLGWKNFLGLRLKSYKLQARKSEPSNEVPDFSILSHIWHTYKRS